MKYYILTVVACLLAAGVSAQDKKQKGITVPPAAMIAFQKAYPHAAKVEWEKEDADYEVNFTAGSKVMSAVYDASGTLKETEENILVNELPSGIVTYMKLHYKGAAIKQAAKITKANGEVNCEAEVNKTDVIFSRDGRFLKEEKD